MALDKAKEIVASSTVVVFSKTHCPYSARAKQLLTQLGATYRVVELDVESEWFDFSFTSFFLIMVHFYGDGPELQAALLEWTGQRTVPNVFVKGKRIGGCDATMAMHDAGNLVPLLTEAGAIASTTATPSM